MYWLVYDSRKRPQEPCSHILQEDEWRALVCYYQKENEPLKGPPKTSEAIVMIAKLGGFMGRKGDGSPGMTTIWRGWERLTLIVETWRACHAN